jgi:plastocyanin
MSRADATVAGITRVTPGLLLTASLLSLGACGFGGPAYGPASDAAAVVEMTNGLAFQPDAVRIKAGETVEWRNRSLFTHTVTDDPAQAKDAADAQLPEGAPPFSAQVSAGEIYRHIFTVPGIYRYFCLPHEGRGMHGQVTVEPAA